MNKKLGLAVASALLAVASSANAGITVPAGDWTLDFGGNVNSYYTNTRYDGVLETRNANAAGLAGGPGSENSNSISTGLLPAAIGIGGKSRQNDLDVAFQFTFFTGTDSCGAGSAGGVNATAGQGGSANAFGCNGADSNSLNIRQAFLTFGDASWGTIKMGRDLGVFGSDAILSDMTLLGVGTGAGGGGNSTLGRIGSGYLYADWVGQIQYSSPNWNGFSFAAAIRQPWGQVDNETLGFDGKASYEWAGDFAGKVWVGFINQSDVDGGLGTVQNDADAYEIGGKISASGFGLVGYYYDGKGMGASAVTTSNLALSGLTITNSNKDVHGGYVQLTYTIPGVGTKIGGSWGSSIIEGNTVAAPAEFENTSWIIGAYHPLTKSLNLVAEYTDTEYDNIGNVTNVNGGSSTIALGAIMFF